jgi:hypothetical protein
VCVRKAEVGSGIGASGLVDVKKEVGAEKKRIVQLACSYGCLTREGAVKGERWSKTSESETAPEPGGVSTYLRLMRAIPKRTSDDKFCRHARRTERILVNSG